MDAVAKKETGVKRAFPRLFRLQGLVMLRPVALSRRWSIRYNQW